MTISELAVTKEQLVTTKQVPHVRIRPSRGWGRLDLHELWEYRDLIYFLLGREVKGRYRQMALGPLWIIIQPLVSMVIYSLIFGVVAKLPSQGLAYPLFSYAGLLPWGFFSGATSRSANSLVSNMNLISKVYFPRLVIPIVGVLSGLTDFLPSFLILVGMMLFYGIVPTIQVITVPFFLLLAAATSLCIGLWVAALSVRFRDMAYGISYLLQALMYASPVVYSSEVIPEQWRWLYQLNPLTGVVEGFRWALLDTGSPPGWGLAVSTLVVVGLLIVGAYYFRRTERTIVDLL